MRYWREIGMGLLAMALGSVMALALLETDTKEPERIETVRYVTETQYVTVPKIVYVERVVHDVVEVIIEVERQEKVEVPQEQPTTVARPPVAPPASEPVINEEPPAVVLAVCEHRGNGRGHQHGVCRKQGFP